MSCDLADQVATDCVGVNSGVAYIDDCGSCVGGTTGLEDNYAMNFCGKCYGEDVVACPDCGSSEAINYNVLADESLESWEGIIEHDESLCIYDMCTDYLIENDSYSCLSSSESLRPYQIGDQLSCDDIEMEFSACYPDCANSFGLSDFEGRVFWLMYEEDW